MVARTADPVAFNAADPMGAENGDMMAGANIYRRVQTKKKSGLTYAVPAVVVIALGAGVAFYAMKPTANPATPPAAVSQQQANNSATQATNAAVSADTSAKVASAANDQAQASSVSSTGNPPATDTQRTHDRAPVRHAQQASVRVRPSATNAGSSASDVSAYTPAPVPQAVTPMQATPAPVNPSPVTPDQVTPAPTTIQPAPATPDAAPSQTPASGAVN